MHEIHNYFIKKNKQCNKKYAYTGLKYFHYINTIGSGLRSENVHYCTFTF